VSRRIILCVLLCTMGCGSGAIELSGDEYARLPRDFRQEIFDAENGLVIARNREDEARDRATAAEGALDDLAQKWKKSSQAFAASGQAVKVPKAKVVHDAHVAYVTALGDVAEAAIRRAEVETRLSRARLDLVKQRQYARIGRATVSSLKPLEDRVTALETRLKAATSAEGDLRTKVQTQLTAWKTAEDAFIGGSADYDTGVWGE
jgi:hypothetical protein